MKRYCSSVLLLLFSLIALRAELVQIFSTAEIHGSLNGLKGISETLNKVSPQHGIYLDAGGFSAGGIYDFQTGGTVADSVRTEQIVQTMKQINYTAVTPGDDELGAGESSIVRWISTGLPLVSANVELDSGNTVIPKYRIIDGDKPLFITGVTTNDPLQQIGSGIKLAPVIESLRDVMKAVPKNGIVILLAHLTSEELFTVLAEFPQIDLVFRGHRTGSGAPVDTIVGRPVVGFGFEGSSISKTIIAPNRTISVESIQVNLSEDNPLPTSSVEVIDCYIMSGCPYGTEAIRELLKISETAGNKIEWHLHFSGNRDHGKLFPGLRSGSIENEMDIVAIRELYPHLFTLFLEKMTGKDGSIERAISEIGIDVDSVNLWIKNHGIEALSVDYARAERLNVTSSPTIFVGNRLYEPSFDSDRFLFDYCQAVSDKSPFCDTFGECLDHSDCLADSGKVGRCEIGSSGKNVCHSYEDAPMEVIQILPDDSLYSEQNEFVETTVHLFPSAKIRTLRFGSVQADSVIQIHQPETLPFELFDSSLVAMTNFDQIRDGIVACDGGFRFGDQNVSGNYHFKRKLKTGERLYFVKFDSPLYATLKSNYPNLTILPAFDSTLFDNPEQIHAVESELKKSGLTGSMKQFYETYLESIHTDSPVWELIDNRRVEEFDSPESFKKSVEKGN